MTKFEEQIESLKTLDEAGLNDFKVPWPDSLEQLTLIIQALAEREQDYGSCVYSMSIAATATFYYMAHLLGVTGFQSSCADMDLIRRTRGYDGPVLLVNGSNYLYPQYDLMERVREFIDEACKPWAAKEARKQIEEHKDKSTSVHPNVLAHWQELAKQETPN